MPPAANLPATWYVETEKFCLICDPNHLAQSKNSASLLAFRPQAGVEMPAPPALARGATPLNRSNAAAFFACCETMVVSKADGCPSDRHPS
jgi:hypothetical protein